MRAHTTRTKTPVLAKSSNAKCLYIPKPRYLSGIEHGALTMAVKAAVSSTARPANARGVLWALRAAEAAAAVRQR
jgi:hypothetical protein